jgi:molybdate transport system ATP-binding protein
MTLDATIGVQIGTLDLDVALELDAGEVIALLGPNGAGKSTILRTLAGLLPIDRGRIDLDGRTIDDPEQDVFVVPEERPIGVVFQDYLLFDHMTVLENVAYGMRARRVPKREARALAAGWLDRLGLADYGDQRPVALSGGQAQRVALARALAVSPRLLLLDEPLAALDVGTRAEVRRDLRQHLATFDGMRVLVTHDPVDAHALADRIAIVEDGRIVQRGTLAELTAHPRSRYVAELVGVNLATGVVADGTLTTDGGAEIVVADAAAGPACAVIRPHSVTLTRDAPQRTSARNSWAGTIVDVDRLGDRARVRLDAALPLVAEITVAALDDLDLRPGDEVHATVKATEIEVSPL